MKPNLYASLMFTNSLVDPKILRAIDKTVFYTMMKMPAGCTVLYLPQYDRLMVEKKG